MRARLEYLTQHPVESVREAKRGKAFKILFQGGASLTYEKPNAKADKPQLANLSLLQVERRDGDRRLTFGRSFPDRPPTQIQRVIIRDDQRHEIDMPGYDEEDRDLTVPPHPDERVADGPTTEEDGES